MQCFEKNGYFNHDWVPKKGAGREGHLHKIWQRTNEHIQDVA